MANWIDTDTLPRMSLNQVRTVRDMANGEYMKVLGERRMEEAAELKRILIAANEEIRRRGHHDLYWRWA